MIEIINIIIIGVEIHENTIILYDLMKWNLIYIQLHYMIKIRNIDDFIKMIKIINIIIIGVEIHENTIILYDYMKWNFIYIQLHYMIKIQN